MNATALSRPRPSNARGAAGGRTFNATLSIDTSSSHAAPSPGSANSTTRVTASLSMLALTRYSTHDEFVIGVSDDPNAPARPLARSAPTQRDARDPWATRTLARSVTRRLRNGTPSSFCLRTPAPGAFASRSRTSIAACAPLFGPSLESAARYPAGPLFSPSSQPAGTPPVSPSSKPPFRSPAGWAASATAVITTTASAERRIMEDLLPRHEYRARQT